MGPSIDSGYSNRSIVLVVTTICLYFVSLSNAAVHSSSRNIVRHRPSALLSQNVMEKLRAGAEDEYDEEYDVEGEYDSEEMDEIDEKLSKAAEAAMEKARKKRAEETKAAIASSKVKATKKKKGNMLKILRLPYVIRAFLNPFTVAAMTKHYFASLFNVNYLEDQSVDSAAGLRSALEQKARQGGNQPKPRGQRKMRPGQAKTLSDLPQLSA